MVHRASMRDGMWRTVSLPAAMGVVIGLDQTTSDARRIAPLAEMVLICHQAVARRYHVKRRGALLV